MGGGALRYTISRCRPLVVLDWEVRIHMLAQRAAVTPQRRAGNAGRWHTIGEGYKAVNMSLERALDTDETQQAEIGTFSRGKSVRARALVS